jgi:hypothetical protein
MMKDLSYEVSTNCKELNRQLKDRTLPISVPALGEGQLI